MVGTTQPLRPYCCLKLAMATVSPHPNPFDVMTTCRQHLCVAALACFVPFIPAAPSRPSRSTNPNPATAPASATHEGQFASCAPPRVGGNQHRRKADGSLEQRSSVGRFSPKLSQIGEPATIRASARSLRRRCSLHRSPDVRLAPRLDRGTAARAMHPVFTLTGSRRDRLLPRPEHGSVVGHPRGVLKTSSIRTTATRISTGTRVAGRTSIDSLAGCEYRIPFSQLRFGMRGRG